MSNVPLFDCLTHPALDGNWIHSRWDGRNRFAELRAGMAEAGVRWTFAVAMGTKDGWDASVYPEACAGEGARLFPVAYLDPLSPPDFVSLRTQGFVGVKIHPRRGEVGFADERLPKWIAEAQAAGLVTLLCTYPFGDTAGVPGSLEDLQGLLAATVGCKIILLHSGAVRLREVMELSRPFKDTLLDLSFTLCEYEGSSLDDDLRFVLRRHGHRVCVGSDAPEFSPADLRRRFEELTTGMDAAMRENIAHGNLFNFTGLPRDEDAGA